MSELSSSILLSNTNNNPISEDVYNAIRNCVENGGIRMHPLVLLPSLTNNLRYEYYINKPDMTLHFIGQQSDCCFFFYNTNRVLYYIVTNHDASEIYLAEQYQ